MTQDRCTWTDDEDGSWQPSCSLSEMFQFNDGGPIENRFSYCPYCGRPLVKSHEPVINDEDE